MSTLTTPRTLVKPIPATPAKPPVHKRGPVAVKVIRKAGPIWPGLLRIDGAAYHFQFRHYVDSVGFCLEQHDRPGTFCVSFVNYGRSSCDRCPRGQGRCRHVQALAQVVSDGLL